VLFTGLYAIEDGWLLSPGTIVLGVVAEHLGEPLYRIFYS